MMEHDGVDDAGATAPPRALVKPLLVLIIAVAVLLAAIFSWQLFIGRMTKKYMGAAAGAPQTVSTAVVAAARWQAHTAAFGTLRAVRGADLAPQVGGVVDQINFESGSEVRAGALLLKLKANDDPAKLAQLQAAARIAQINYKRDQEQLAGEAISQSVVDADLSTLTSARAQVAAQQALIEEKTVRAPFAGKLGIRQIDEGQYLAAGTAVVTLQALDPIYIDFYVPQQALARLRPGQAVGATIDTYGSEQFGGTIASINSKVDSASRNVQVRAKFANSDQRLIPGMYANVEIDEGDPTVQLTVPQAAVSYNPYGDIVYVVERDGADPQGAPRSVVHQRFVKLGATRGDQVAVSSGLAAGDTVVTAGQMKLRNGALVTIGNQIIPADELNPSPPNE